MEVLIAWVQGWLADKREPRAQTAHYDAARDEVLVTYSRGARKAALLRIPRAQLEGLPKGCGQPTLMSRGQAIEWPHLDIGFTVSGLAAGVYGSMGWMQSVDKAGI